MEEELKLIDLLSDMQIEIEWDGLDADDPEVKAKAKKLIEILQKEFDL